MLERPLAAPRPGLHRLSRSAIGRRPARGRGPPRRSEPERRPLAERRGVGGAVGAQPGPAAERSRPVRGGWGALAGGGRGPSAEVRGRAGLWEGRPDAVRWPGEQLVRRGRVWGESRFSAAGPVRPEVPAGGERSGGCGPLLRPL